LINKNKLPAGMFISFEGIDGCGKSVQTEALRQRLLSAGYFVKIVREPGGTALSEKIRAILLDRSNIELVPRAELFLYEAARAQLMAEDILPALSRGEIIISDRFTDSTLAYQGHGRSLDKDFIKRANIFASKGRFPDCTFVLDITWEESIKRRNADKRTADRMEMEQKEFFLRVRQGYLALAKGEPQRICLVDGSLPIPEIEETIYTYVTKNISRLSRSAI